MATDNFSPTGLVNEALDLIEKHSIQRLTPSGQKFEWLHAPKNPIDWQEFRVQTLQDMQSIESPTITDVHGVIDRALIRLDDHHSLATYADSGGDGRRLASRPVMHEYIGDILHITVPRFSSPDPAETLAFQNSIRDALLQAAQRPLKGVVVDLRPNKGGNMWPMLRGLSPLLGPGTLGYFAGPDPTTEKAWDINYGLSPENCFDINDQRNFPLTDIPLAVLGGPETASSGEAVFMAFRGRKSTQSFGEPTGGYATANSSFTLPGDGRILVHICSGVFLDRQRLGSGDENPKLNGGPIQPDIVTKDPLNEAVKWLKDGAPPLQAPRMAAPDRKLRAHL